MHDVQGRTKPVQYLEKSNETATMRLRGWEKRDVDKKSQLNAVMVCGAGHSGSTLLGLILDGQPDAFYVGEGGKIRYLHDAKKPIHKRVCKICGEDCPVWSNFVWDRKAPLYRQVADHVGASLIVDTTKDTDWIRARTSELRNAGDQACLVLLIRDGRAVVNSRMRKFPERAPETEIARWLSQIRAGIELYESFDGPKVKVHYEALSRDPTAVMENLCSTFGIAFDPAMLDFQKCRHHPLGGNSATQFVAAKEYVTKNGKPFVSLSNRGKPFYESLDGCIKPDTRWKQEFTDSHAELFARLAGSFNEQISLSS
jgi:hypothetical protein